MTFPRLAAIRFVIALAALLGVAGASPASAHPHVWVTVESTVLFENGSIVGIRYRWSFDEYYTMMAIQGLDTNNDGNYDRKELSELAQVNMDGLKEFNYFTQVKLADQAQATGDPRDYFLEYAEATAEGESEPAPQPGTPASAKGKADAKPKVLSLHFTLPLKQPVLAEAPGFTFTVSDPTFFIAFELAKKDPVTLGEGAPAGCRISIGGSERQAEDAKRLGEAFFNQMGSQGVGLSIAKPVAVSCEPRQ